MPSSASRTEPPTISGLNPAESSSRKTAGGMTFSLSVIGSNSTRGRQAQISAACHRCEGDLRARLAITLFGDLVFLIARGEDEPPRHRRRAESHGSHQKSRRVP